jgi:hypothetical protein
MVFALCSGNNMERGSNDVRHAILRRWIYVGYEFLWEHSIWSYGRAIVYGVGLCTPTDVLV